MENMIVFAYQKGKQVLIESKVSILTRTWGTDLEIIYPQKYFILCWNESNIYQFSTRESDEIFVADQTGFNKRFMLRQT